MTSCARSVSTRRFSPAGGRAARLMFSWETIGPWREQRIMSSELRIPALVAGKRVTGESDDFRISYEGGNDVLVPRVGREDIRAALDTNRGLLKHLPIEEIVAFFDE